MGMDNPKTMKKTHTFIHSFPNCALNWVGVAVDMKMYLKCSTPSSGHSLNFLRSSRRRFSFIIFSHSFVKTCSMRRNRDHFFIIIYAADSSFYSSLLNCKSRDLLARHWSWSAKYQYPSYWLTVKKDKNHVQYNLRREESRIQVNHDHGLGEK